MLDHLMPLLSSPWLYVVVFLAVAIDGFLPFMPSEAIVIGAAALSATGSPSLIALGAAATAGGMAGDQISYRLGRRVGGRVRDGRLAEAITRAKRMLLRHGGLPILIGRFLPYGRTATTLTAGSVSLPPARFRLFSALASTVWAVYVIALGRLGGATFAHSPLLGAAFGVVVGMALAGVCALIEKRRPATRERELVAAGRR
ncbi:membrane protein DedA with SNARE-associated domain [Actinoplanes octamycinicus]|uniref:Membrane protein DedA with SNARE-associated domain n=1 Tax=Actinoplanes octamycinicus TaxID=135948 RepID=A0A7W7M948_9ACTN|nr:DedA family protein [Actinoplanes octamycinicus]MBB4741648.1 membrane protein DedA with SNARE-associated domain [Actinoplanes octamycinicus]GIE57201.1 membrane protein [Actinoplanes octamycinicus]